ncbi:MAG TPA: diguanylate cyclase response regulator [Nevskia sp.]|nr:diguanylate cyclase response regulator [Nevskia sp.]
MTGDPESEFPRFAEEPAAQAAPGAPWKILVADDDPGVHAVTRLALAQFLFDGRPLAILEAYSGAEAVATMRAQPDIALIFMDVVMESEHAGLDAVDAIRNELANSRTRIVLRTGQPGRAPEEGMVGRHGINDYSEKTELTATRLKTLVHARLQDYRNLSLRDTLTGLFSRSFLDESLEVEEARSGGTRGSFAVALLDLDRFREVNEQRGRVAGDAVLKSFAGLLHEHVRMGDIACRYGGEEFVVVMPGTAADAALRTAESIRRKWEATPAAHEAAGDGPLTVSIGVAVFPQHARTPDALMRAAGEALRRAKEKGGNRSELAVGPAPR